MVRILPILSWVVVFLAAGCRGDNGGAEPHQVTVQNAGAGQAVGAMAPRLTYVQRQGRDLFLHYCAVCHGESGAGDGFNAWNLAPRPRDLSDPAYQRAVSDAGLMTVISEGGLAINKSNLMPGWRNTLSAEQIATVTSFVRTLDDSAGTSSGGPGTDLRLE